MDEAVRVFTYLSLFLMDRIYIGRARCISCVSRIRVIAHFQRSSSRGRQVQRLAVTRGRDDILFRIILAGVANVLAVDKLRDNFDAAARAVGRARCNMSKIVGQAWR